MAQQQLTTAEMDASLHIWLDTEFTYFKVEQLAAELATLTRDEQDFILGWIRRIASTHITLAWQFGRRAPALLSRMERRLLEAWAVHTCDVFDRTGLQTALRVMEEVDSFDETQHRNDAAGALFDDIAPILGNFVCGLSGRRLHIEEGDAAWTDGERIVLPPLIAALPLTSPTDGAHDCLVPIASRVPTVPVASDIRPCTAPGGTITVPLVARGWPFSSVER